MRELKASIYILNTMTELKGKKVQIGDYDRISYTIFLPVLISQCNSEVSLCPTYFGGSAVAQW